MTATATESPPDAIKTAFEQSWWGQIAGLAVYCGMSWAGVLNYPRLGSLLGAAFLGLYLAAVLNIVVAAEYHSEAMR
jgi:hypothetical protein